MMSKSEQVTSVESEEQKGRVKYPFGKHHQYSMDRFQFILYEKGVANPTYHPTLESMLKSARESLQKKKIEQSADDVNGFVRIETALKETLKELHAIGKGVKLSDVKKEYEKYRDEESRIALERLSKREQGE